jgi:hypothetical protein
MLVPETLPPVPPAMNISLSAKKPLLNCKPYSPALVEPLVTANDWKSLARSFSVVQNCSLSQGWRSKPETGFKPTQVSVGWDSKALWVYAELDDEDIFNSATKLNDHTWMTGDVFEIFLRPAGAETYFEFHVTPENNVLQLRWPNAHAVRNMPPKVPDEIRLSPYYVTPLRLKSWTRIERENQKWYALISLDWDLLERKPVVGESWAFSFSRYDVTQENSQMVLSSTSVHKQVDFHSQHEWGTLTFQGLTE